MPVPDRNAGIVVLANLNLTAFPEAVRPYFLNQLLEMNPEADQKEIFARNEELKKLMAPPTTPKNPGSSTARCSRSSEFTKMIITVAARSFRMELDLKCNGVLPNIPPR